jgi:hypothetical protein
MRLPLSSGTRLARLGNRELSLWCFNNRSRAFLTVLAAISTKSLLLFYIMADSTCGKSFIKLIEHISSNHNLRTAILVCENHKAYYNKEAKIMMD